MRKRIARRKYGDSVKLYINLPRAVIIKARCVEEDVRRLFERVLIAVVEDNMFEAVLDE